MAASLTYQIPIRLTHLPLVPSEIIMSPIFFVSLYTFLQSPTKFKSSHVLHSSYRDCVWNLKQPSENASLGSGFGVKCGGGGEGILAGVLAW